MIQGYVRPDGAVGVRNHVLVVPTVICAARVCERIAELVPGSVAIPHPHGCSQIGDDARLTGQVLARMGHNPNVGAVLIMGLGCETLEAGPLARAVTASGKPVEVTTIQQEGGSVRAIEIGAAAARRLVGAIAGQKRHARGLDALSLGVHAEPEALRAPGPGRAVRELVREIAAAGGRVVLAGGDMDGAAANGEAGVSRAGSVAYGAAPEGPGVWSMAGPPSAVETLAGLAAAGCQLIVYLTARGVPTGCAAVPVVKACTDPVSAERFADHADVVLDPAAPWEESQRLLREALLRAAGGELTRAELLGHEEFNIHRVGVTL